MKNIKPNQPYDCSIESHLLIESIPAKTYFVSLIGRDPQKYEWASCDYSQKEVMDSLESELLKSPNLKIPHIVVSFPHLTRVYRWGDPRIETERETNIYQVLFEKNEDLVNNTLKRENTNEIVCPGEIYLLEHEMINRAVSSSLFNYLTRFTSDHRNIHIKNSNLIRDYLEKQKK